MREEGKKCARDRESESKNELEVRKAIPTSNRVSGRDTVTLKE